MKTLVLIAPTESVNYAHWSDISGSMNSVRDADIVILLNETCTEGRLIKHRYGHDGSTVKVMGTPAA